MELFKSGKLYSLADILMGAVVSCDKCGEKTDLGTLDKHKAAGWSILPGKDLCPKCAKANGTKRKKTI